MRAAARAASQPAWPPPTTTTSNLSTFGVSLICGRGRSFADAEGAEDRFVDRLDPDRAGDLAEAPERLGQVEDQVLFARAFALALEHAERAPGEGTGEEYLGLDLSQGLRRRGERTGPGGVETGSQTIFT